MNQILKLIFTATRTKYEGGDGFNNSFFLITNDLKKRGFIILLSFSLQEGHYRFFHPSLLI